MVAARLLSIGLLAACTTNDPLCESCERFEPSTLFISDYGASSILRYDGVTGQFVNVFAAGEDQLVDRPASVRLGPTGHLYSAGFGRGDVVRYDIDSGAMMDVFYQDTRYLEEPVELAFWRDELVVLGNDTANVVVLDPLGRLVRSFGYPVMRGAHDFVIDAAGQLFVATDSHVELGTAIQVWDLATGQLQRHFATRDQIASASAIALGDDGVLYVADYELGRVVCFDANTGTSLGVLIDGLSFPVSLDIGARNDLYVLDSAGVHRYEPDTGEYSATLVRSDDGHLRRPRGITFITEVAIAAVAR